MVSKRQEELLRLIVEDYIKTARPVGSKALCDSMRCSSATIRSEMNYLEEIGLLEKTHISSGRVPSEKGYRYYVDNIMTPRELNGEDMLKLQTIVDNKSLVVNDYKIAGRNGVTRVYGYWTLSSYTSSSRVAWYVYHNGDAFPDDLVSEDGSIGVRPVINLSN